MLWVRGLHLWLELRGCGGLSWWGFLLFSYVCGPYPQDRRRGHFKVSFFKERSPLAARRHNKRMKPEALSHPLITHQTNQSYPPSPLAWLSHSHCQLQPSRLLALGHPPPLCTNTHIHQVTNTHEKKDRPAGTCPFTQTDRQLASPLSLLVPSGSPQTFLVIII